MPPPRPSPAAAGEGERDAATSHGSRGRTLDEGQLQDLAEGVEAVDVVIARAQAVERDGHMPGARGRELDGDVAAVVGDVRELGELRLRQVGGAAIEDEGLALPDVGDLHV